MSTFTDPSSGLLEDSGIDLITGDNATPSKDDLVSLCFSEGNPSPSNENENVTPLLNPQTPALPQTPVKSKRKYIRPNPNYRGRKLDFNSAMDSSTKEKGGELCTGLDDVLCGVTDDLGVKRKAADAIGVDYREDVGCGDRGGVREEDVVKEEVDLGVESIHSSDDDDISVNMKIRNQQKKKAQMAKEMKEGSEYGELQRDPSENYSELGKSESKVMSGDEEGDVISKQKVAHRLTKLHGDIFSTPFSSKSESN